MNPLKSYDEIVPKDWIDDQQHDTNKIDEAKHSRAYPAPMSCTTRQCLWWNPNASKQSWFLRPDPFEPLTFAADSVKT